MKRTIHCLVLLALLMGAFLPTGQHPVQAQTTFPCASVTEIPQIECEALVALYNSTNGPNWAHHTNWLETNTPDNWYGVDVITGHVTGLHLSENQLTGSIPPDLGSLSNLTSLALYNNQLAGSIPPELGSLSNLTYLSLFNNQLAGSIPTQLGYLSNLEVLSLSNNQLTGSIAPELGNLSNLDYLYLDSNQLTGNIPSELGNLSDLYWLYLDNNQLTGSIPPELGSLSNLQTLSLPNNQLTGSIPPELGNLSNLQMLRLKWNGLSGSIPTQLGNLSNLRDLLLDNNPLTGRIPSSFILLTSLNTFYFFGTQLCEPADPAFQAWKTTVGNWQGTGIICQGAGMITGRITRPDGNGLADVTVSAGAAASATTSENGSYQISIPSTGTYYVSAAKEGYSFSPAWRTASVPPDQGGVNFTGVQGNTPPPEPNDPPPPIEPGKPYVENLQSCISGPYFFNPWSLPVDNRYTATVNWQGLPPQSATFSLNGVQSQEAASGPIVSHVYHLNHDFQYDMISRQNTIAVEARDSTGKVSPAYTLRAYGVDFPVWLPYNKMTMTIPPFCVDKPMKAEGEILYPSKPFEGKINPPDWFPFLGGKPFGIKETQAGLKLQLEGSGEGEASLFGQTGFDAAGSTVTGKLTGSGAGLIVPGTGIKLDEASMEFELAGTIEKEKPLVDIICKAFTGGACPLEELEVVPVIGGLIRWFNQIAVVKGEINPALNFGLNFHSISSGLKWENGTAGSRIPLRLSLALEAIKDILTAEVYGGGEPAATFQVPPDPSYLKKLALELFAGLKLKVLGYERSIESSYEWNYDPTALQANEVEQRAGTDSDWHPQPRNYAVQPETYAVFQANQSLLKLNALHLLQTDETLVASNVYPQGTPEIIRSGDQLFLFWVHDDIAQPVLQGKEIFFTHFDGSTWTTPAGVTSDALQDFAPHAAVDGSGNIILVWERNKVVQPDSAPFDAEYTNAFDIAWSMWNGSSWSAPALLTSNSIFDHAPILTTGMDGQPLLIWRQNAAGELIGNTTNPDTILTATWNGTGWNIPRTLTTGASILAMDAARYDGAQMAVVYAQDMDGDVSTDTDQELFIIEGNDMDWGAPVRLTNDELADKHPTLLFTGDGSPRLLWLKGDTLTGLIGNLEGTPEILTVETSSAVMDYAAAQNAAGRMVLVWQGLSEEGVDIFYATYDETSHIFSRVVQLTHNQPLEKFMDPLIGADGNLLLAFNRTQLEESTRIMTSGQTISGIVTFGQTDLYLLQHAFGPDLALENVDVSLNVSNPEPGAEITVSVNLHNPGDQAVPDASVAFYLGDPGAGGVHIGTVQTTEPLRGGDVVTLALDYTLPSSGGPFEIYALADADNLVAEGDEGNNQGSLAVSLPDLTITDVTTVNTSGQTISLSATVLNEGVSASAANSVTFWLNDPINGTLLGEVPINPLDAGSQTTATFDWNAESTANGSYKVYAVVNGNASLTESNVSNNQAWTGVAILPDLDLQIDKVVTIQQPDGTLQVNVWIKNNGMRPAENITMGVYNKIPATGSQPIDFVTITIPAGETYAVGLNLGEYSYHGFYLGAGFDADYADADMSNNSLSIGEPPNWLYLPALQR